MTDAKRAARRLAVVGVLAAAFSLTACGGGTVTPTGDELYTQARDINLAFKQAVGEVQAQVLDDEWVVRDYGDTPEECAEGYMFRMERVTPDDWRIGSEAEQAAEDLGAWMAENGWTDVSVRTFDGVVDNVVVQARNADAHVDAISIDYSPGDEMDHVVVRAESTCEPGDADELFDLLRPGFYDDVNREWPLPETESPDATPLFGFTEDGEPR